MIFKKKNMIMIILCISLFMIFTSCDKQNNIDQNINDIEKDTTITKTEVVATEQCVTEIEEKLSENKTTSKMEEESTEDILEEAIKQLEELDVILND